MTFYMLRDTRTGLWYKRHHGRSGCYWGAQNKASVWTSPAGARACLGAVTRDNRRCPPYFRREPEIVALTTATWPTVGYVSADDWKGLYLDGHLVEEGHRLEVDDVLRHLGIECNYRSPDDAWLEERGSLPKNFDEVPE